MVMNKRFLFWRIVVRSLLLGLQIGAVLGFVASFYFMLSIGFWAVLFGLMYGCALGSAMGLVNGLLLACLICRFFFPYTASGALRRVTQTGSVAVSLLMTALIAALISGGSLPSLRVFSAIALPLAGAAAWWASWRVDIWYETLSKSDAAAAAQH